MSLKQKPISVYIVKIFQKVWRVLEAMHLIFWHFDSVKMVYASFSPHNPLSSFKNTVLSRTWTLKDAVHRQFVSASINHQEHREWRRHYSIIMVSFWQLINEWQTVVVRFIPCCLSLAVLRWDLLSLWYVLIRTQQVGTQRNLNVVLINQYCCSFCTGSSGLSVKICHDGYTIRNASSR